MTPGPCRVAWKRQPRLEGKEDSWKQPSQGCHICTWCSNFRLSKQSGKFKVTHKWLPRNLISAAPWTRAYVPMTCPSLGWRLSLIYLEQKQQDSTLRLGRRPGPRQRINRPLLLIPIPQLPMGSAANHRLS